MTLFPPAPVSPDSLTAAGWKCHALSGHMGRNGPLWTHTDAQGQRRYGLLMEEGHLNPAGVVHGGALLTLADHAISAAVWQQAGRQPSVTVQLDSHFVAVARAGDFVVCTVEITHSTRSMVFARAALHAGAQLVLQAQGVWKVQAKRDNATHD